MEIIVFLIAGAIVLGGAIGVVLNPNPVHAALSLVAALFGVAVLFILQEAHFLALVQVVVYAGAIVVLFLFVIMLLGVDRTDDIKVEPLVGQKSVAVVVGLATYALILGGLFLSGRGGDEGSVALTGIPQREVVLEQSEPEINQLAFDLFGRSVLAFEATALLLTIATVGAVVLVTNRSGRETMVDEPGEATR